MNGQRYMVEMVGPGVALLDFDRDGDLDVFLVQGRNLGPDAAADDLGQPRHKLFRNDWIGQDSNAPPGDSRRLKFTDVSEAAGLTFSDYGMGAAAGDYDGDGWTDLLVTSFGTNRLLRNTGAGTFVDVTREAGLPTDSAWSTSAAWVDYDRDGWLDLFVCRYLNWDYKLHKTCRSPGGKADYCGPNSFDPMRCKLYRNLGGGGFEDVSRASKIGSLSGAALGVLAVDVDSDGWLDLFVANDGKPNHLWMNQHDGTFREEAVPRGCAFNAMGNPEANMGLIAADFRNVGRMDLFITHLRNEHSTYYENLGDGQFVDITTKAGLDASTRSFTGFGTVPIDFDNDGWLDIFSANGEVRIIDSQFDEGIAVPMRQKCLLLRNQARLPVRFEPEQSGEYLSVEEVGRGLAAGDLDNDGDLDLVVSNNAGPTRLLINDVGHRRNWIGFHLQERKEGFLRDSLHAAARIERPDGTSLLRSSAPDGSYLASSDPRVLFGLGDGAVIRKVVVTWPDQTVEEFPTGEINRYHSLERGTGKNVPP